MMHMCSCQVVGLELPAPLAHVFSERGVATLTSFETEVENCLPKLVKSTLRLALLVSLKLELSSVFVDIELAER